MKNKRYLAITGFDGKDQLYTLSKTKEKQFERAFGKFDSPWENHEEAVQWLLENGKFVDYCTCLSL